MVGERRVKQLWHGDDLRTCFPTSKKTDFQCFFQKKTIHRLTFCISGVVFCLWFPPLVLLHVQVGRIQSLSEFRPLAVKRRRSIWTCIGEPNNKPSRKSQLLWVLGLPSPNGSFAVVGCVFSQNYELLCFKFKDFANIFVEQTNSRSDVPTIFQFVFHNENISGRSSLSEHQTQHDSGWWFGTFFHILGIIPTDFHIVQRG